MRRPRWFWGHGDRRPRGFKGLVRIRCHGPILEATFFFLVLFLLMESSWSWFREIHYIITNDAGGDLTQNWDHFFPVLLEWFSLHDLHGALPSRWTHASRAPFSESRMLSLQLALKIRQKWTLESSTSWDALGMAWETGRTHRRNMAARNGIRIPISLDENPNFQWCWLGCFLPQMILRGWNLIFLGHKPFASLWMLLESCGIILWWICVTALGPNHHHLVS